MLLRRTFSENATGPINTIDAQHVFVTRRSERFQLKSSAPTRHGERVHRRAGGRERPARRRRRPRRRRATRRRSTKCGKGGIWNNKSAMPDAPLKRSGSRDRRRDGGEGASNVTWGQNAMCRATLSRHIPQRCKTHYRLCRKIAEKEYPSSFEYVTNKNYPIKKEFNTCFRHLRCSLQNYLLLVFKNF